MPWWAWLVCAGFSARAIQQLWRARTRGLINAGVVDFDRASSPIYFWFHVGLNAVVLILFGGAGLLVAFKALAG